MRRRRSCAYQRTGGNVCAAHGHFPASAGWRAAHGDTCGAGGRGCSRGWTGICRAQATTRRGASPSRAGRTYSGPNGTARPFYPNNQGCCYTHGCFRGLPWNSMLRIDAWTGDLTAIEADLAESWDMSDDGLTLTMQLQQGVMFFDKMAEDSIVPAEYQRWADPGR